VRSLQRTVDAPDELLLVAAGSHLGRDLHHHVYLCHLIGSAILSQRAYEKPGVGKVARFDMAHVHTLDGKVQAAVAIVVRFFRPAENNDVSFPHGINDVLREGQRFVSTENMVWNQ